MAHRLRIYPRHYPGTGDTFSSVLTGSLIQGDSLSIALDRAVQFVTLGIRATFGQGLPSREGILLERILGSLFAPVSTLQMPGSMDGDGCCNPGAPPSKTDMGSASQRRKSKSRTAGRPGRERSIRYNGMGQRIC